MTWNSGTAHWTSSGFGRAQSISAGLGEALTTRRDKSATTSSSSRRRHTATSPSGQSSQPAGVAPSGWRWIGLASLDAELLTSEQVASNRRAAVKDQRELNGIEAQTAVVNAGSEVWRAVRSGESTEGLVSPTDVGILDVACAVPSRIPTEKQSLRTVGILKRLREAGCQLAADVV